MNTYTFQLVDLNGDHAPFAENGTGYESAAEALTEAFSALPAAEARRDVVQILVGRETDDGYAEWDCDDAVEIYVDEPDTLQAAWNRFDAERVQLTRDGGDTTHANAACAAIAGALRDIHDAPVVTA